MSNYNYQPGRASLYYTFTNCTSLEVVDFSNCPNVVSLYNTATFQNTNNTYRIIVPNALYDQWIAATNWSNASIKPHIEKAINGHGVQGWFCQFNCEIDGSWKSFCA